MIEYLEHHIVDHCNLNCVGCTHFSPLVKKPWFEDINDFIVDFRALASRANVRTIRIMGGEPLLHPQVCEFLLTARELFPHSEIQLVTNGLLLSKRKEELLPICNEYNIVICTSNYHLNLDLNEVLKGFKFVRVDDKGLLYNACLNCAGTYNGMYMFDRCDLHIYRWYYFQNGRFYPCCISPNIHYFKEYFGVNIDEGSIDEISISVYDHTEEEIKEFLSKQIPLCKYCNTIQRQKSYHPFSISKKEIEEWTCQ